MALEPIPSRLAALRGEYCLSIGMTNPGDLPALLLPYYDTSFRIELRVLYEKGKEIRRQWIFRDNLNFARLTASGTAGLFGLDGSADAKKTGFIEIRDAGGFITRELQFADDLSQWEFLYFYKDDTNTLVRVETRFKEAPAPTPAVPAPAEDAAVPAAQGAESPAGTNEGAEESSNVPPAEKEAEPVFVPMYTDYYRYTRSGSLRAIDRSLQEGAAAKLSRITFPRLGSDSSSSLEMAIQGVSNTSEFFTDINPPEDAQITYTLDNRARVLTEVWKDKDGKIVGEYIDTWSGDRLQSVRWKSDDDERLIEYDYDSSGNRIAERDFRQGVLERSVTSRDGKDTEEIYMNGKLILRAHWENGKKISEERIYTPEAKP